MSEKQTSESSMSTQSVKRKPKNPRLTPSLRGLPPMEYAQEEVLSAPLSSRLSDLYKTEAFRKGWANNIRLHVASNILHLRRHRQMSQAEVARAMHTSQSAVARIESAQENITLDTLERLINTLNGRLHISIPPHEWATTQAPAWWSAPVPSGSVDAWNLTTLIARKTPTREQVIMGLERPRESILIGETPSIAAGDLLIDGKGTTYFVRGKNG